MSNDPAGHESEAEYRSFQLYFDESGRVEMARGNASTWLGLELSDLEGRSVAEFAAEESAFAVSDLLVQAALREFMPSSMFFIRNARTGAVNGFDVTGKPQNFNELYRANFVQDPSLEYGPQSKNTRGGFVGAVERAMRSAQDEDKDIDMTFVDIGDVGRLSSLSGMDAEGVRRFTEQVENRLKAESLAGDGLGRMERGKYGLLHERNADLTGLRSEIETYARDIDPEGMALKVGTSTVNLDAGEMEAEDVRTALEHAVDEFADSGIDAVIFDTLGDSQAAYLDKRQTRIELLRECLDQNLLSCAFTPVCDMARWATHHMIAEFQAELEDDGLGAAEIKKLTEKDPEFRTEIDAAQCRYIMTDPSLDDVGVAVNIAIRSLLDPEVVAMLIDLRSKGRDRLFMLRLTGLDEIPWERVQSLSILRRAGFSIALYGKDVGAVTAEKLEILPADYILLDPSFVISLDQLKRGLPMLAGMVKRCAEYEISIIFEGVIEAQAARMLSKVEGALCMGPYFGEALDSIDKVKLPRAN
ncbi:MAG: EAL domain-containing protein [Alphaproteobacteria bacterium]